MTADAATKAKRLLPLHDESAPVVCTIGEHEIAGRVAVLGRIRAALCSVERTDTGLLLVLPIDDAVRADVDRFVVDEKRCCTFWGFAVVEDAERLVLRWDGPPSAAGVLDRFDAVLRTDEPIEIVGGYL